MFGKLVLNSVYGLDSENKTGWRSDLIITVYEDYYCCQLKD